MQHEATFTIDGVAYEVEWEMDCSIPVWCVAGHHTCGGDHLPPKVADAIEQAVRAYMDDS